MPFMLLHEWQASQLLCYDAWLAWACEDLATQAAAAASAYSRDGHRQGAHQLALATATVSAVAKSRPNHDGTKFARLSSGLGLGAARRVT